MIIYVDIDNTITETSGCDYENAKPIFKYIEKINQLYFDGHYIVYWTARGVGSGKNYHFITSKQLLNWGCRFHELRCDKPVYDLFIDDKTINKITECKL